MSTRLTADRTSADAKARRKHAGMVLKQLRAKTGYTQKELAEKVGLEYYTFVSQIENGSGRVPVELYGEFAKAYGVDVEKFARMLVRLYDPAVYHWLFYNSRDEDEDQQLLDLLNS